MGKWRAAEERERSPFDEPDDGEQATAVFLAVSTPSPIPSSSSKDPLPHHNASARLDLHRTATCRVTGLATNSPLRAASWHRYLQTYPDAGWAHRLVHDIIHGVDIGYRGRRTLRITSPNFTDGGAEDRAVSADIANEVNLGRIAGPFASPPFQYYRCSPLKTVAKKGSTTKYRIIHHLSYPHGRSVNSCTAD